VSRRERVVSLRLTDAEHEVLRCKATSRGITLSDLLREAFTHPGTPVAVVAAPTSTAAAPAAVIWAAPPGTHVEGSTIWL
jgi:hypothetical protein